MASKENKSLRLGQIFSARLVLEVFGGGGAIWGFSEVCTLRNPDTQEEYRLYSQIVAGLFAIRFFLQIIDFLAGKERHEKSCTRLFQIFLAKIVLEIFGAGGAIWGFSEATTLRVPETQEFFRKFAITVAVIHTFRYFFQMKDFVAEMAGRAPSTEGADPWVRFFQIFAAKLVLEVFGGAGAIWGFSEVMTYRNPETQEFWRFVALVFGFCFYIRFLLQMKDYVISVRFPGKMLVLTRHQWWRLFFIFSAKLVLEVFGGAGAIWGFSEALTLRNPETQGFWRFNALTVGYIFSVRFCCQIKDYLLEVMAKNTADDVPPPETVGLLA